MDCVSLGDPLCGWCVVEGKCSRRSSCKDSTVSERYLTQGNTDSCITSISIDPPQYVLDTESIPHQVKIHIVHFIHLKFLVVYRLIYLSHLVLFLLNWKERNIFVYSMI